jgi:hypothetical protein
VRKWLEANRANIATWSQAISTIVQVIAVCIAGYWTYHLHVVTGETDENVNVSVEATSLPYSKAQRLLIVHFRPKNVGKVPVTYDKEDDARVVVKQIPDDHAAGAVDLDKLPVAYERRNLFARYGEPYEIDPGIEFDELATFVVPPGTYHVEGIIGSPNNKELRLDETIGGQTVIRIE